MILTAHHPGSRTSRVAEKQKEKLPRSQQAETLLAIQYSIARTLAESPCVESGASKILQTICQNAGWDLGAIWLTEGQNARLRCFQLWHDPALRLSQFVSASRRMVFTHGVGIPGTVWDTAKPFWICDVQNEVNFPRAPMAAKEGLRTAFAFPICVEKEVIGVIEFFSRQRRERDKDFFEMVSATGNQIGQFIERKRSEEIRGRLAAIVECSQDAIISKNLDGNITSWNRGAEALYGYSFHEVLGRSATILFPSERFDEETKILESIRAGQVLAPYDTIRRHKNGTLLDVSVTISPVRNSQGEIIGASTIARNIGEQKRVEQALRTAREELAQANHELEQRVEERTAKLRETISDLESFSYTISHDLRAPLRTMQGFSQMLLEDYGNKLGAEACEYIQRISVASARLNQLVQDVLSYNRVARNHAPLNPVNADALLLELLEQEPAFQPPQACIEIDGPIGCVIGQESLLTQCFSNLLGNAIKFIPEGIQPHIRVRREQVDSQVRIWIEDNGIGIDPKDHRRIWGIFERSHSQQRFEGTGVGLAIVRKAVEKMEGSVGVESEPDKGSKFWIQLAPATK